jgi:hypothetical protein
VFLKRRNDMSRIATTTSSSAVALPRNFVVSALAASCAIASLVAMKPAHAAYGPYPQPLPAIGNFVSVSVVDRNTGQTLPVYRFRGEYWVAGTPGAKYSVSINNRRNERLLAVTSVDGVNVLTGETAGVDQVGYVFDRYQRYDVSGWRKSDHEIAAFTFVASPRSYAERTGRPDNVGTIGVALYRERYQQPRWYQPQPRWNDREQDNRYRYESHEFKRGADAPGSSSSAPPAPSTAPQFKSLPESAAGVAKRGGVYESERAAAAPRVEEKLGTGHGAREYDSITRTNFERATDTPVEVIRIRYDSHANLIAMGVIPEPRRPWDRSPNPFPDNHGSNGYVPDPPRWFR